MFRQYRELKAQQPAALLFFRMGDFYEMFWDDAVVAARELELTLTSRNKADDQPIPMAGVPHHAAEGYIQRLLEAGHRVAIADQVEDPALATGLVRREIVRVVTPGVVLDPTALEAARANWLAAVHRRKDAWGLGLLDLSTGDLRVTTPTDDASLRAELERTEPREVLCSEAADHPELREVLRRLGAVVSDVDPDLWRPSEAVAEVRETLGVASLEGFGVRESDASVHAAGALLRYARDTSGGAVRNVHTLREYRTDGYMVLDETTRRNLELFKTLLDGRRKGSLIGLLDRTGTAMGARLLREWLSFPLLDLEAIRQRQLAVQHLAGDGDLREVLRRLLQAVADLERIGARVAQGTAHARDLAALRRSLQAVPQVSDVLPHALAGWRPADLLDDVRADLEAWLADDPPISLTDGGLIRGGAHDELDELTHLSLEGMSVIGTLEIREREATGISSLKVKRNKVFGYFIEITRANLHRVPEHYLRKQTLTNAERYITVELKELEERVLGADERRKELEYTLFTELRERVAAASPRLQGLARALARLDVLADLAEVAVRQRWVRPEVDGSLSLELCEARHPVVEALLEGARFVANDVVLDLEQGRQLVVLTGPNMAGKSTIIRQVALAVLLAQIGSFVPAASARIGLADRIFTRVGAADHLTRGQSTFMVEMSETATILHHATARSLVILDEIGRGTSTYDGLAIAWAVAEDLAVRVGCRTMFATHYHELCELADEHHGVMNQSIAVLERGEDIVFLRQLREGGASRSYGIQCARLAGLPRPVVEQARGLLTRFEKHAPRGPREQLSLFGWLGGAPPADDLEAEPKPDPLREALDAVDPDTLTPRQALDVLYRLKGLA